MDIYIIFISLLFKQGYDEHFCVSILADTQKYIYSEYIQRKIPAPSRLSYTGKALSNICRRGFDFLSASV